MRYFVNLNSRHICALPESPEEETTIQKQYELLEISQEQFYKLIKGDKNALASVPVNRR